MMDKRAVDENIIVTIEQQMGWLPPPIKIMAKRPGTAASFMAHRNQIFEGGPLDDRERALVALSTAVALKSSKCASTQADHARDAGATEDEIVQTILISSLLASSSPLHQAFAAVNNQE